MKFAFEERGFERYWHADSPFISLFWTQLSTAFEPGERFFIDSARAMRREFDDPELQEELREFCKQEGHHTAQHLRFDRKNAELGVDVESCRRRYTRVIDFFRGRLEPDEMLAATAALEHFTAGFAHQYLTHAHISEGADPNVKALWMWHATEELEHKATCHDIYRRIGGSELKRVVIMPFAWLFILALSLFNTFSLLRRDGKLGDLRDVGRGLAYLFGPRGLVTGMLPSFLAYFSPRFHPWRDDDSDRALGWQRENAHLILR